MATRTGMRFHEEIDLCLRAEAAMRNEDVNVVPPVLEVRGEVYLPISAFNRLNERLVAEGKKTAPNPRNAAAGSLRQLNPNITAERDLSIWVYGTGLRDGLETATHWETLEWLNHHHFKVNPKRKLCGGVEEVLAFCREWEDKRPLERYAGESRRLLKVLDARLHGREWIMGDEYTIADIALLGWVRNLIEFYEAAHLVAYDEVDDVHFWLDRCLARPAVQRGLKIPFRS